MDALYKYIYDTLGIVLQVETPDTGKLSRMPFFLKQGFQYYKVNLFDRVFILALLEDKQDLGGISHIEKQLEGMVKNLGYPLILVLNNITAVTRKRLVEKGINFIVPGKQLYLPAVMIDFNEVFKKPINHKENLLPSAQVILLHQILKRNINIAELPFKQLAFDLGYSAMAISKAVENLKYHELCEVKGTKEKHIQFNLPIPELWEKALPMLVDPVIKRVYIDQFPDNIVQIRSNLSALTEYSNLNPEMQEHRAMEKALFYDLKNTDVFVDMNPQEGRYCLEVWKYNPLVLTKSNGTQSLVDPLSLYLSMKHMNDERIKIALEGIIKKYIW
jgi:hypothetical protein